MPQIKYVRFAKPKIEYKESSQG